MSAEFLRRLAAEPLLHFLVLGGIVFALGSFKDEQARRPE